VIEDAIAGVKARRAGDFAFVVGVNPSAPQGSLLASGADYEVPDLSAVTLLR
jgi:beta-phosphoglucomutase-like phosphatase (HAD superfamily)